MENTDLNGNDITPVTERIANSWEECGNQRTSKTQTRKRIIPSYNSILDHLCQQFANCKYWTWKGPDLLHCWLKTSAAGIMQENGVQSGSKGCSSLQGIRNLLQT